MIKENRTRAGEGGIKAGESKTKVRKSKTGVRLQRRMSGKSAQVGIALILTLLLLAGCGASGSSYDTDYSQGSSINSSPSSSEVAYDYGYDNYDGEMYETEPEESGGKSTGESNISSAVSERKMIRNVNMSVETKEQDYDRFLATLQ